MGAPLFFMISGALLIQKEESIAVLFKKRILRMLLILVIYTIGYMWYFSVPGTEFLKCLIEGKLTEGGWYLYSYLSFLIILPLLRKLVKQMETKDFVGIIIAAVIVVGILPIVEYGTGWELKEEFNLESLFQWNIFYPIMGYYFGKKISEEELTGKKVLCWQIAGILSILISCWLVAWRMEKDATYFQDGAFHKNLIMIPTIAFFIFMRYFFQKHMPNATIARLIQEAGATTFGVYLFDNVLRDKMDWVENKCYMNGMVQIGASFIWILAAMLVGMAIVWVLKKIPIIRKLI
jgi:surface polysaccharide O-acyltransferase-like enzyme